jgi:hypothetical protein
MIHEMRLLGDEQLFFPFGSHASADFMRRVKPEIDRIASSLAYAKFVVDPFLGAADSQRQSIKASAQKREGRVIELALREALKENKDLEVWKEPNFAISAAAEHLIDSQSEEDCWQSELPYGEFHRPSDLDVVVYRPSNGRIAAYESKRGNGRHDSTSIRAMRANILCARMLLKGYAQSRGLAAQDADAKVIFYYGCRSLPAPYSLVGAELDEHFNFQVQALIESAVAYFRDRVRESMALMEVG